MLEKRGRCVTLSNLFLGKIFIYFARLEGGQKKKSAYNIMQPIPVWVVNQ